MASSIQKYVDDLALQMEFMPSPIIDKVNYFLRALGTFLLCATRSRENGDGSMEESLKSVLVRIDQVFRRNAETFEVYCRDGYHGAVLVDLIHAFEAGIKPFEVEINGLYAGLTDFLHLWTIEDAMEVIDSVLADLETFHGLHFCEIGGAVESLEERTRLFASFVRFVAVGEVKSQQLVNHVSSAAFDAARVTSHLSGLFDAENPHGWKQIEPEISSLLQKLRPIDVNVSEAWKTALADVSRGSQAQDHKVTKDSIDFLLWCLWEELEANSVLKQSTKTQVRPLWDGLKSLRATLTEHPHKLVEDTFQSVICDAGILIFSLHHQDCSEVDLGMPDLQQKFDMILLESVEDQIPVECFPVDLDPWRANPDQHQTVGLEEDVMRIAGHTISYSKRLGVIPIVGMAGVGKTTLALQVYNHPDVIPCFAYRAWCTVSHISSTRKVLFDLLNQVHPSDDYPTMDENDLAERLQTSLTGKQYLVVLDDVWDMEALHHLKKSFPDDKNGSRILLTSRDTTVSSQFGNYYLLPQSLRPLTGNQSWELLQKKVFPKGNCPLKLYEIGKKIATACGGLPLTVIIVAGLLTTPEPDFWEEVLESINSGVVSRSSQMIQALELSYSHLPEHLRPCFLYTAFFPEAEEVSVKWLIWLLIAEGFVLNNDVRSVEDVARQYILDLVGKNLATITRRSSTGEAKALRLQDSVREFCINKGKEENLLEMIKGYEEILAFNKVCNLPRLFIQSNTRDVKSLRLSCPNIHSLLFMARDGTSWRNVVDDISFIAPALKTLRVFHIRQVDLGDVFPTAMELLVELRYLAVRGHFSHIPSGIGNLSYLQTLIVDSNLEVSMPATIWDLHKLRHLCINNGFRFPIDNSSGMLYELQSCSTVIIESPGISEKLLSMLPNVRKLKCRLMKTMNAIQIPECLDKERVSTRTGPN